ncbi:MAG: hypothetical protein ABIB71_09685, partial [Candidatus Woesearchaeota archaeon]
KEEDLEDDFDIGDYEEGCSRVDAMVEKYNDDLDSISDEDSLEMTLNCNSNQRDMCSKRANAFMIGGVESSMRLMGGSFGRDHGFTTRYEQISVIFYEIK